MGSRGEIEAADSFAPFSVATVFLLVSLVARRWLRCRAQRRLRQLGMLAVIEASQGISGSARTNGAVVE